MFLEIVYGAMASFTNVQGKVNFAAQALKVNHNGTKIQRRLLKTWWLYKLGKIYLKHCSQVGGRL